VGTIVRVLDHGAYPILEIDAAGKEVLIPLPDHMTFKVDRDLGTMQLELPEGLLEVYLGDADETFDGYESDIDEYDQNENEGGE
jgi:hypothetical protein